MKIELRGKTYPMSSTQQATIAELLLLEQQTRSLGRALTVDELNAMSDTVMAIKDPLKRAQHPDSLWLLGVGVWLAKRRAGEKVTFEEAIDFAPNEINYVTEPGDEALEVEAPDPHPRREGSAQGPARRPADHKKKASKSASTSA